MSGENPGRAGARRMLSAMAIPEPVRSKALEAVERFCENRVPAEVRDQLRLDFVVRGNAVTVRECRQPWREDYGPEWSVSPVAQLRFDAATSLWRLYWMDSSSRWHEYPEAKPNVEIEWLLREVDLDPHGAFWG